MMKNKTLKLRAFFSLLLVVVFALFIGFGNGGVFAKYIRNESIPAKIKCVNYNYVEVKYDANGGIFEDDSISEEGFTSFIISYALGSVVDGTYSEPTREGYTFNGWYYDEDCTENNEFDPDTDPENLTEDITVYAKWIPIEYNITYELDGGALEEGKTNPDVYTVESEDITLNNPVKEGYEFLGWTGSNGDEPETTVTIPTGSIEDKSYTANWTEAIYNITYDLDGGELADGVTNPSTYKITSDDITLNNPEKDWHIFLGWTGTDLTGSEETVYEDTVNLTYEDGYCYTMFSQDIDLTIGETYNVNWKGTVYEMEAKAHYGYGYPYLGSLSLWEDDGVDTGEPLFIMSGDGTTAVSSNDSEDYSGELIITKDCLDKTVVIPTGSTGDRHYVAHWQEMSVTLMEGAWIEESGGFNRTVPETATTLVFTDEVAPDGVTVTDVSYAQDGGVVAWMDDTTYYVSTQRTGVYVEAPADANFLFACYNADNLTGIDLTMLDTSNATSMRETFASNSNLQGVAFGDKWDTSNVETFMETFDDCSSLISLDLSKWNTQSATYMGNMFSDCRSLEAINFGDNFNTSKVTSFNQMFYYCTALKSIDVSGFDTSNAYDFGYMFANCENIKELDISNFDTSSVSTTVSNYPGMEGMFDGMLRLEKITLGAGFSFSGADGTVDTPAVLPTPDATYITDKDVDGNWYNTNGEAFVPNAIPSGIAGSYTAFNPFITVTYDANGGSFTDETTNAVVYLYGSVNSGTETDPTREGYAFVGWYTDAECTTAFDLDTATGKVTVYAKWTEVYTIEYNLNGGVFYGQVTEEYTSLTETFNLPKPTREGYTFVGWYETEDFSTSVVTEISVGSTGNKVFYAKWETFVEETYSITYNLNGGTVGKEKITSVKDTVLWDGDITGLTSVENMLFKVTDVVPTIAECANGFTITLCMPQYGYQMSFTEADAIVQSDGATYALILVDDMPCVLVAFEDTTIGDVAVSKGLYLLNYSDTYYISSVTVNGFTGFDELECGEVTYTGDSISWDGNSIGFYSLMGMFVKVTDIVPSMEELENGYTINMVNGTETVSFTQNEYPATQIDENYTMLIDDPESGTPLVALVYNDFDMDGVWAEKGIYFINMGSSGYVSGLSVNGYTDFIDPYSIKNPTEYTNASEDITLYKPTKEGYTFTGWTGSNGDVPEITVTIPTGSTGDRTYTANWEETVYTITYNLDGGVLGDGITNPTTYTIGSDEFTLNNPTKENYIFLGWTGSNGSNPQASVTVATGSTGDRTYTANWEEITFGVTYDANGGYFGAESTTTNVVEYDIEGVVASGGYILPEHSDIYLGFDGWYTDADCSDGNEFDIETGTVGLTEDITIYAKWKYIDIAYAVYSETDNSLTFYNNTDYGYLLAAYNNTEDTAETYDSYKEKAVTGLYTGFEEARYSNDSYIPWYSYRENITSVTVNDEISPVNTRYWFYGFKKCGSFNLEKLNTSEVTDMAYMFHDAGQNTSDFSLNLNSFDTSEVTDMTGMFSGAGYYANNFKLDIGNWNTSKVIYMSSMFASTGYNATTWDIGNINTHEVTVAGETYTAWDTSNVTTMGGMFSYSGYGTDVFTLDISNWNTSKVSSMNDMFNKSGYEANTWDIGNINTHEVTVAGETYTAWDVSSVTDMSNMFNCAGYNADKFELNLSKWTTSKAIYMSYMFNCAGYNSTPFALDLSNFDTASVSSMLHIFNDCRKLEMITLGENFSFLGDGTLGATLRYLPPQTSDNIPYADGKWYNVDTNVGYAPAEIPNNTPATYKAALPLITVTYMSTDGYFESGTTNTVQYRGNTIISGNYLEPTHNTKYMEFDSWYTDEECTPGNELDILKLTEDTIAYPKWKEATAFAIYSATDNSLSFYKNTDYESVQSKYDAGSSFTYEDKVVTELYTGFEETGYSSYSKIPWYDYRQVITSVDVVDEISPISTAYFFYDFIECEFFNLENLNTSEVTDMSYMFYHVCASVASDSIPEEQNVIGIEGWDTSEVTDMTGMFYSSYLKADELDLTGWDTAKVSTMTYMFYGAFGRSQDSFVLDISTWNTSEVTDMSYMFYAFARSNSLSLGNINTHEETIDGKTYTAWDTSKVSTMKEMFLNCGYEATTFTLDISNWNTSKVTNMLGMFGGSGYKATTWSIGNINTKEVTVAGKTYTAWDTSNVTNMFRMFKEAAHDADSFVVDISNWNVSSVSTMGNMFESSGYKATTWSIGNINTKEVTVAGETYTAWGSRKNRSYIEMFKNAAKNATFIDLDLGDWDTPVVYVNSNMFYGLGDSAEFIYIDLSGWDTSVFNDQTPENLFYHCGTNSTGYEATISIYVGTKWNISESNCGLPDGSLINVFTVTYDANEGIFTDTSINKVEYFDNIRQAHQGTYVEPTREGYAFNGWFTDASCTTGNEYDVATAAYSDITVYASWIAETSTASLSLREEVADDDTAYWQTIVNQMLDGETEIALDNSISEMPMDVIDAVSYLDNPVTFTWNEQSFVIAQETINDFEYVSGTPVSIAELAETYGVVEEITESEKETVTEDATDSTVTTEEDEEGATTPSDPSGENTEEPSSDAVSSGSTEEQETSCETSESTETAEIPHGEEQTVSPETENIVSETEITSSSTDEEQTEVSPAESSDVNTESSSAGEDSSVEDTDSVVDNAA